MSENIASSTSLGSRPRRSQTSPYSSRVRPSSTARSTPGLVIVGPVMPSRIAGGPAATLGGFRRRHLEAGVDGVLFEASGIARLHGLRLTDGREVAVKVHTLEPAEHLAAVQAVQRSLAADGPPCPRPLVGPHPLGD